MKKQGIWTLLFIFTSLITNNCSIAGPGGQAKTNNDKIIPEAIPERFNIPGNQNVIQQFTDDNNVKKIRQHAWKVWAGLTADSQSSYEGKTLPIWETWLATSQVFQNPPKSICPECELPPLARPSREYHPPHQFLHGAAGIIDDGVASNPTALVGFNKFEPSEVRFLWTPHIQNGQTFNYTSYTDLTKLNNSWPSKTPIKKASIIDTPRSSIELKPVIYLVKAKTLTAIPFWQGPNASSNPNCANVNVNLLRHPTGRLNPTNCHPDPSTWTHCVLVDAINSKAALRPATSAEFKSANIKQAPQCTIKNAQYIGIDALYHFPLNKTEANAYNKAQGNALKARKGDNMALVAMHVNTKEIITWTWQTFWWQAGQETPNNYPGSAKYRPLSGPLKIHSPWDNYNMCAAYAQTTKPISEGGEMNVCFNPYLETSPSIPDGLRSNCVSCHGTAAFNLPPSGGYPLTYAKPVKFNSSIQYFLCSTKTDFSYAIQGNSANAPANPPPWSCNRK